MQAVWLENGKLSLREVPVLEPAPGEARVRVLQAGICNTDLELVAGYYPYTGVLGHEFVGHVERGPSELLGQRVVGEINAACGICATCKRDLTKHCENRTVLGIVGRDGAFAPTLALPVANLHPVAEAISDDEATFTEPLAAALQIQHQTAIGAGRRVLVVGTGKLGQLIARTFALTGCELQALGRRQSSLDLLAAHGIDVLTADSLQERAYDVAVECTGNAAGFELARRALRPRGTLVMKSTYAGGLTLDASAVVVDELQLIGSRCGPFARALEVLAGKRLKVEDLIEARYPLADAPAAFEHASRPGALKVLLEVS
ncbi:MAG: alcohol dehydrogenase catalytic domain-containing protein [Acidobacteria bacterium]|nr:alcohol dehydrogenase catalytic domain-containing protein [Acidobacteriota bacterium]